MSEQLVYMFDLIKGLFRSLVQFCLNGSFIYLLLLKVCSDSLYNFVWTARLYVCFITVLFRYLVQFCLNSLFICFFCHNSSVHVLVYRCLSRSFIYLMSSEVCSGLYVLLSEQIIHHIFVVIRGAFRSLWIIVWTDLYIFPEYNLQDATFLGLFISVRRSTCFRRFFRPSSAAQNCTYSAR